MSVRKQRERERARAGGRGKNKGKDMALANGNATSYCRRKASFEVQLRCVRTKGGWGGGGAWRKSLLEKREDEGNLPRQKRYAQRQRQQRRFGPAGTAGHWTGWCLRWRKTLTCCWCCSWRMREGGKGYGSDINYGERVKKCTTYWVLLHSIMAGGHFNQPLLLATK